MSAYYNENDPFAAAWLRELITVGLIADGEVDERSIAEVTADDVRGFTQCHFFAGIGGWSYALRLAGWPDDREVWTGSCPCQPFSSAGTQAGGHDPRDLWPVWFELVRECRPVVVFGEQVEAAIGHGWLDRLCDDVESEGYAVGACGLPAASVGAFHIRQRLWFVAESSGAERGQGRAGRSGANRGGAHIELAGPSDAGELAHAESHRTTRDLRSRGEAVTGPETADARWRAAMGTTPRPEFDSVISVGTVADASGERRQQDAGRASGDEGADGRRAEGNHQSTSDGADYLADPASRGQRIHGSASRDAGHVDERDTAGDMGNADQPRSQGRGVHAERAGECATRPAGVGSVAIANERRCEVTDLSIRPAGQDEAAAVERRAGFWRAVDWIPCTDGKARPVEPGTFPLAHGVSGRVGRLRGYGNAIVPQVAQVFIESYLDTQ